MMEVTNFYGYQKYINIKKIQSLRARIPLNYYPWKIPQRFFLTNTQRFMELFQQNSGLALNYLHFPDGTNY